MGNFPRNLLPALLLALACPVASAWAQETLAVSGTGTFTSALLYRGAASAFEEHAGIELRVVDPDIPLTRGLEKLLSGEVQVVGAEEPPSPQQVEGGAVAHLLGQDSLGIWVNAANPVAGLSRTELRDILTGEIAAWDRVGGGPGAIRTFLPPFDAGYGTSDLLARMILSGRRPGEAVDTSLTAPWEQIARVSREEGGLCFASPSLLGSIAPGIAARVKLIPLEGVLPFPSAVARGDYLLNHPIFLVTLGPPEGAARQLVEFLTGPEGQAIVARDFLPARPPAPAGRISPPGQDREKTTPVRRPDRPARGRKP